MLLTFYLQLWVSGQGSTCPPSIAAMTMLPITAPTMTAVFDPWLCAVTAASWFATVLAAGGGVRVLLVLREGDGMLLGSRMVVVSRTELTGKPANIRNRADVQHNLIHSYFQINHQIDTAQYTRSQDFDKQFVIHYAVLRHTTTYVMSLETSQKVVVKNVVITMHTEISAQSNEICSTLDILLLTLLKCVPLCTSCCANDPDATTLRKVLAMAPAWSDAVVTYTGTSMPVLFCTTGACSFHNERLAAGVVDFISCDPRCRNNQSFSLSIHTDAESAWMTSQL